MKWIALLLLGASAIAETPAGEERPDGPAVGERAPDFKLPLLNSDKTVRLRDLRGKPTVLIFGSYT